ncbi:MAG: hypothetical protein M1821_006403 [Bathelium mastoideum]|nr:MAG: hypothetical protein M1821_006403 [Bathelium mastoideum]KAI9693681.1 MAG: hypothetical protein M1822_002952 [Bathelium mastoideum]
MAGRTEEHRGSITRNMSSGRGGAGNMTKERRESVNEAKDLATPTIKQDVYTTGRGGTGNMVKNDKERPEVARAAQDVDAPRPKEPQGTFHVGRGGAANVAKSETDSSGVQPAEQGPGMGTRRNSKGFADKGKELLGKIGIGEQAKK